MSSRSTLLAVVRLGFAALAVVAIAATLVDLSSRGVLNPANFFSYFTIQSNLISIVALTISGVAVLRANGKQPRRFDMLRGGAVVYMTVTGVVYGLLLENTDVDTPMAWVDAVVHKIMPIVIAVDWLIDPPAVRIAARRSLLWVVYPMAWVAYTMIRGALVGWYPYPFLDPSPAGYGPVAITVGIIFVAGVALALFVAWIGNVLRARRTPPTSPPPETATVGA